jgi:hypothetical protein
MHTFLQVKASASVGRMSKLAWRDIERRRSQSSRPDGHVKGGDLLGPAPEGLRKAPRVAGLTPHN